MTRRDAYKAIEVFAPSAPHFAAIAADIETAVTDELEKALSEPVTAERFVAHVAHEATVAAAFARFVIAVRRKIGIRESLIVDAEAALPAARQAIADRGRRWSPRCGQSPAVMPSPRICGMGRSSAWR